MPNLLKNLIDDLPEVYQSIFGHSEFTYDTSRTCDDRLIEITKIYKLLEGKLERPLKVLDFGCAQGYFSLNLAQLGATVQGIDFLDKNIAVCNALADENTDLMVTFNVGRIEDVLATLKHNEYDLVLGLSVFHHIVHEHGLAEVQGMLATLAEKVKVGIFELALATEPLYWGPSQADDPLNLLSGFSFVHEIKQYPTHLSNISRPLVSASNYCWILNGQIGDFNSYSDDSHMLAKGVHENSRRYFFNNKQIIKIYKLNNLNLFNANIVEFKNEVNFLSNHSKNDDYPQLILSGENQNETWLVREKLEGELLLDVIDNNLNYNADLIIENILKQLVTLEKENLYHNDLRTWNVLIDSKSNAKLIDYGSISTIPADCVMPNNIFLSFYALVKEILDHAIIQPELIRDIDYDLDKLSEPYRSIFIKLFLLQKEEISFLKLYELIIASEENTVPLPSGIYIFEEAQNQIRSTYKTHIVNVENNLSHEKNTSHKWWAKASEAEAKASEAEAKAHEWWTKATEAEANNYALQQSTSWKITKPFRSISQRVKWFTRGVKHWLTFAPSSRPRRVSKQVLLSIKYRINSHPKLKRKLLNLLNRFPEVKARLKKIGNAPYPIQSINILHTQGNAPVQLSPQAKKIYSDLETAIEKQKGKN